MTVRPPTSKIIQVTKTLLYIHAMDDDLHRVRSARYINMNRVLTKTKVEEKLEEKVSKLH